MTASAVRVYMRSSNGTRAAGFDLEEGISVLVSPRDEDKNSSAEEWARLLAKDATACAALVARALDADERAEVAAREKAAMAAKVPPTRPARVLAAGYVRFDERGGIWLMGKRETGWSAFGVRCDSWDDLFRRYDVRVTGHGTDDTGLWWRVENVEPADK